MLSTSLVQVSLNSVTSMLRLCRPQLTTRGLLAASRSLSMTPTAPKHAKVVSSPRVYLMWALFGDTYILSERVTQLWNYSGAFSNWAEFQNATGTKSQGRNQDTVLLDAVVGLHALTMPQDPKKLLQDRMDTLASLLVIGLSPEKSTIFCQVRIWFS